MELSSLGNTYFDSQQPWKLAKNKTEAARLANVLYCCLEALKVLALISFPIIPETAQKLWALLGYSSLLEEQKWNAVLFQPIPPHQPLPQPVHLFSKVEDSIIEAEIEHLKKLEKIESEGPSNSRLDSSISIEDVQKLDLRVAQIETVEKIPKSRKLLKLSVDLGEEKRIIVAGIGESYPDPNALIGKKVIIVANLKPALLMGVASQGMLLAAQDAKGLELPTFTEAALGSRVR
jgi:methionyl-tRNA synthetase